MKPSFSSLCRDIKANATTAALSGGRLLVMGGARPESTDVPITDEPVLAEVRLNEPAFWQAEGGEARMCPVEAAPGLQDGIPTWCRFETALGQAMIDGDAGAGKKNTLILNPVQQDGEVWVEEFVYEESAGG